MGKRSRACEACHALKIRCEPSPSTPGACKRCASSNLSCAPAARRWQRDRIAELEEQVKRLQEMSESSTRGSSTPATSTSAKWTSSTGDGQGTSISTSSVSSEHEGLAVLDASLDDASQIRCLEVCSVTVGLFWPMVPLANSSSTISWLESIKTERPTKFLAIFGFTMSPISAEVNAQTQDQLRSKVLEILGLAAVGLKAPSLDLVQAALIAGFWGRPSLIGNDANPYQLVMLAHDLSVDLGFGGAAMQTSAPAWFSRIRGPLTLEMQQTWLVSWIASTMAAIGLRRADAPEWVLSHSEALDALEKDFSDPLLLEIIYTVRLHAKVAGDLELCDAHSFHDINSELVAKTQAAARDGLGVLSNRPLAQDPQLRFWRTLVTIYANEPVLHTDTNKMLFGEPYVPDRIGVAEFARPLEVTRKAETALISLVEACHTAIKVVLEMEPGLILSLPSLCFGPAVSYALSILVKVFVAMSAPGNTYGQVVSRRDLGIKEAIGSLMDVKASLLTLDPHMGNWNTRLIASTEWLGTWLDDYECIMERTSSFIILNTLNITSKMHLLTLATLATTVVAQLDLATLISSQDDLSTLASLLALVPEIAETLASASNITIFAPTNDAFDSVPRDIPEGEAIEYANDSIAIGALLSNHVFQGYYPAKAATNVPLFVQSLLDGSFVNARQPFGNFTGGQYNGIVRDGDDVVVISGEETLSYVTEADIKLGETVIIHKIDKPLSFGAPLQLFTRRDNLLKFNAALNAADFPYNFGNLDEDSSEKLNISDFTIFVPNDAAFEAIGSVLEGADLETLREVLSYHIVDDVVFSTDLANVTAPSLQGGDLTFTVAEDGSAWVNGAKIVFPNVVLFNCVAHVIDGVLNPADAPFDRAALEPAGDASDRLAFPSASAVSKFPFSVVSYDTDGASYTTPELLRTLAAVDVSAVATATATATATDETSMPSGEPTTVPTAGASKLMTGGVVLMALLVSMCMI
ncbi:hypothetical protein FZEAL_5164 [Fusarium zealandicum]|uniref:Zn(2)-C6 fungal-type domain-containing protein n=1 Tax=Fusarium zealandicum TaxID=1053134 RepID=A0A8H4XKR1_9HYPO|nr:hypothetical protein FZEAL_5164 [Fusarium zealandicum]